MTHFKQYTYACESCERQFNSRTPNLDQNESAYHRSCSDCKALWVSEGMSAFSRQEKGRERKRHQRRRKALLRVASPVKEPQMTFPPLVLNRAYFNVQTYCGRCHDQFVSSGYVDSVINLPVCTKCSRLASAARSQMQTRLSRTARLNPEHLHDNNVYGKRVYDGTLVPVTISSYSTERLPRSPPVLAPDWTPDRAREVGHVPVLCSECTQHHLPTGYVDPDTRLPICTNCTAIRRGRRRNDKRRPAPLTPTEIATKNRSQSMMAAANAGDFEGIERASQTNIEEPDK